MVCRAALRVPIGGADGVEYRDVDVCALTIGGDRRAAHGRASIDVAVPEGPSRLPQLLLFFDASRDCHVTLDYLTAYFA
jgi:hypothetical protein